jgi:hypothetical protein
MHAHSERKLWQIMGFCPLTRSYDSLLHALLPMSTQANCLAPVAVVAQGQHYYWHRGAFYGWVLSVVAR